ncbi:type ISP restriction/modification enzyme [Hwangdonia lutea]|uniref:Type ISP restriction/modification enzyme n=1 Tax=Hwangdonia lutea TaxID=3075823 RepID=A0AA97HR62_9FLAO|nr:type ISP restriction/modification enzyme [Hwangdonia sp. SCSIO 19198]WOD43483.1 type ISP restriction/modification enzyme [Hwangdonia sp. SCSIO 19198]
MTLAEYAESITHQVQTSVFTSTKSGKVKTDFVSQIAKKLDLDFAPENESDGNVCFANSNELRDDYKSTFAPIDILNYIYAVLHSAIYRENFNEFLKIDFSSLPYPKDTNTFWELVKLGGQLRQLHLLEFSKTENYITSYPIDGDNVVTRKMTKSSMGFEPYCHTERSRSANGLSVSPSEKTKAAKDSKHITPHEEEMGETGKVWINDTQYFDKVPQTAWEFYIGGYQSAQKWLKDRQGDTLTFEDILHYQKIIVALTETRRIMEILDGIDIT